MDDEKIIELFFARSEQGISELAGKYGTLCKNYSYNIVGNSEDAEECVNDAYLGVWNSIPPQKPNPLKAFLLKILRNISVNKYKANKAKKRSSAYTASLEELEGALCGQENVEAYVENRELSLAIEGFLAKLSRENRVIFMRRYWFAEPLEQISRRVGLTENAVAVRLARLREKMKKYFAERGISI